MTDHDHREEWRMLFADTARAANDGDLRRVQELVMGITTTINGNNANNNGSSNNTNERPFNVLDVALHRATVKGHYEIVQWLLKQQQQLGSCVHARSPEDGFMAIHIACVEGHLKIIKLLLDHDSAQQINARTTNSRMTPLHLATFNGHLEIVQLLVLEYDGAEMNPKIENDGLTPLHFACSFRWLEIIKFLIDHGADVNSKDVNGWTPLNMAFDKNCNNNLEAIKLLLDNGADIHTQCNKGKTLLHHACEKNKGKQQQQHYLEVTRFLIENTNSDGADDDAEIMINRANQLDNDKTPLHCACEKGWAEMVKLLLTKGANANAKTRQGGLTALDLACNNNKRHTSPEVVWVLVRQCPWLVGGGGGTTHL